MINKHVRTMVLVEFCVAALVSIAEVILLPSCSSEIYDSEPLNIQSQIKALNYLAYLGTDSELNIAFTLVDEKDRPQALSGQISATLWSRPDPIAYVTGALIQRWDIQINENEYADDGVFFLTLKYDDFKARAGDNAFIQLTFTGTDNNINKTSEGITPLIIDPGCCPNIKP